MIKKYRKKPIVIEAIHYQPKDDEPIELIQDEIADFIGENIAIVGEQIQIETLEGEIYASIGDYIIKGINGEFYPCKPDIFEKTYEKLPSK